MIQPLQAFFFLLPHLRPAEKQSRFRPWLSYIVPFISNTHACIYIYIYYNNYVYIYIEIYNNNNNRYIHMYIYIYTPTHIQYYFIPIFPVIPYMNTGTPMVAPCLSLSRHGKSEPNDPDAPRESKGQKATATGRSETAASEQSVFSW